MGEFTGEINAFVKDTSRLNLGYSTILVSSCKKITAGLTVNEKLILQETIKVGLVMHCYL